MYRNRILDWHFRVCFSLICLSGFVYRLVLVSLQHVAILLSGVFGFLPKFASNGVIFVVALGVILRVLINSATSEASLYGLLRLSIFITESLDFSVLISRSTIPMDR